MPDRPPYHLPTPDILAGWPEFSREQPLRILMSSCLAGLKTGYDGSNYGEHPGIAELIALPNVRAFTFCPEHFSFGTPRALCDIVGGNGHDVLAGHARVMTSSGEDWTDGMVAAAREMLRVARENAVQLAVLMDISAACGSQVIYAGLRSGASYQAAHGVCAALLIESGIPVVSQRDFKTLDRVFCKLDPKRVSDSILRDHHEHDWYRGYFARNN